MAEKETRSVCSVCCLPFSKSKTSSDSLYPSSFERLSAVLNSARTEISYNNDEPVNSSGSASDKNLTFSNFPFVCPGCVFIVTSALDKKNQVMSFEKEVRSLQLQILKALRNLQSEIDSFKDDVNQMETLIAESNENVKNLDDFFLVAADGHHDIALKDVIQFREKVLTVFGDLCRFSSELIINPLSQLSPISRPNAAVSRATRKCETTESTAMEKVENEDNLESWNLSEQHIDNLSPLHDEMVFVDDQDDGLDNDPAYKLSVETDDNSCGDGDTIESDDEFVPPARKFRTRKTIKSKSIPSTLKLPAGISPFRKAFLTRVITKAEMMPAEASNPDKKSKSSDPFDDIDPMRTHWMTYDTASDTVTLKDIKITILGTEEGLECSKCGYKSKEGNNRRHAERLMYDHVLGRHLKLFTCPQCPTTLMTQGRFRQHVLSHQKKYDCEICGKSLKTPGTFRDHKWLHMTEDEKAEAVKSGISPPVYYKKQKSTLEERFHCSTCGKGFHYMCDLKEHQVCHEEDRNFMCPRCGKTFKSNAYLNMHLKNTTCQENGSISAFPFQCDQCPRKFKFQSGLKAHQLDYHSGQSPRHKCPICDKAFRTSGLLSQHKYNHSDAKQFVCKNQGCGVKFKVRRSRLTHENSCKFAKR